MAMALALVVVANVANLVLRLLPTVSTIMLFLLNNQQ